MQNFLKHILTWVLAGIFLVSFTGLRLLIHHCMACESSDIYLFAQVDDCCEHHNHEHNSENTCSLNSDGSVSCCADKDSQCENCCENEVVYIMNDYEVLVERQQFKVEPFEFEVASILLNDLYENHRRENKQGFSDSFIPPPKWVGKDFILFSHQLKTDHISFQS